MDGVTVWAQNSDEKHIQDQTGFSMTRTNDVCFEYVYLTCILTLPSSSLFSTNQTINPQATMIAVIINMAPNLNNTMIILSQQFPLSTPALLLAQNS